jgi:prophage tail gpP-like protein
MVKTQSGSSTVQEQAEWHVRVDRGTATKTAYKVLDWRAGTANALWRPNQLTAVYDPFAEIDCDMLIEQVEYLYSEKEGAVTMLRIVPPAAYERINESSRQQSRHGQKSRK